MTYKKLSEIKPNPDNPRVIRLDYETQQRL